MSVLLVCMYAYHIYSMQCLQRLEEDVWSLELKLQMFVSHLVSAGNWAQGPLHKWAVLLTTEPLLQPWYEKSLFRSVAHTLYLSLCIWYARTRARSCVWRCQASFRELGSQNWTQLARLGGRRASERQLCVLWSSLPVHSMHTVHFGHLPVYLLFHSSPSSAELQYNRLPSDSLMLVRGGCVRVGGVI